MTNTNLLSTIITAILASFMLLPAAGQLQASGYSPTAFFRNSGYFFKRYAPYFFAGVLFAAVYPIGLYFNAEAFRITYAILFFAIMLLLATKYFGAKQKTPLKVTPRLFRLSALTETVIIVLTAGATTAISDTSDFLGGLPVYLSPVFTPIVAYVCNLILYPFEKLNNLRYITAARKTLSENPYLIKIGITGSFGKTSVKNILKAMLETRYTVAVTDGNYNTPMGISKSLKNIDSYTDVFIAEMGARKTCDITELCKIVAPKYGIVTGVTGQHLETFKTLDNIYNEKFKLIDSLPKDGYGVVNRQGVERYVALPKNAEYVGAEDKICYVKDVTSGAEGSTFTLVLDCKEYSAKTKLLGEHNLQNIVSAAALAYKLNVPPEKIVRTIETLKSVPHRLQLIKNGGLTIIDDTYNANPVGSREALQVLKTFEGRKIVVTPGMVELGDKEEYENGKFGEEIAAVADMVLLIGGARVRAIYNGLIKGGFDAEKILNYKSLAIAERDFPKLFADGDTVIFINDLPDIYG